MATKKQQTEQEEWRKEFKVSGDKLMAKVRELIKEGNARRIIIQNAKGKSIIEIPLTIGAVGVLIAPVAAAIGAVAALIAECTIVVVKDKPTKK
ncbi:MAG: DUF4342 domain-containing protein [Candidatus Falkowbacteria bacterium]